MNFNEFLERITFTYVTFAAIFSGHYDIVAVKYNRLLISKFCSPQLNQGKFVPSEYFTKYDKVNSISAFAHFGKASIPFVMAVRPIVRTYRMAGS